MGMGLGDVSVYQVMGFGGWVKAATSKFGYCEFSGLHLIFVFEFFVFLSSSSVFLCS